MSTVNRMLEDIRRTQRVIDELTRSSAVEQIMREAERIQQLVRPTALDQLMRDMDRVRVLREQVARSINLEAVGRVQSQIASAIDAARITSDHFQSAANRIASDAHRISQVFALNGPALRSSMLVFEQLTAPGGVLGVSSSLATAIDSLRQTTELSTAESLRTFLDQLDQGVGEAIDQAPTDPTLRLSWYGHLLSILLFILSIAHSEYLHHLSSEASADFQSRVMRQFEILNERLDELQPSESTQPLHQFYLVGRQGPLTARPRPHSTVLRWLQPGELVWVRARKGRWVRIHYVDSIDGTILEGWVRKKHLTR